MEGLYINSSSQDQSYDYSDTTTDYQNYSNITSNYQNNNELNELYFIRDVVTYIIIAVGLPLTLVAIYALYSMVRSEHVAPIYLINLLITDILQFCCMIVQVAPNVVWRIKNIFIFIYLSALFASVYFMVCISLERYLVIAHPLWYRCRRTIKTSVVVCVLVWVLSAVCIVSYYFTDVPITLFAVLLLLPFPLLIFFLVGTLKALSASISVPSDEKRRIVGILVLVLLIYTLLFLPDIIWLLIESYINNDLTIDLLSLIFLSLNPLADSFLYVFMRKGTIDKLLASVCCCRMDSNDISSPSV
ncbi:G-protein coupled receptor 4-like [Micropterus salmoides]|uniref:G-protein coupled receptor 4-like n=1 Tax=Micropterus salmoides TaxID=27706 RepID=UPI0018EA36F6|nr:G-protein coupled receptor 4-like [Micropterus salmoides]